MSSSMDMHYNTSKKQADNLILKPGTDTVLNTKYLNRQLHSAMVEWRTNKIPQLHITRLLRIT